MSILFENQSILKFFKKELSHNGKLKKHFYDLNVKIFCWVCMTLERIAES